MLISAFYADQANYKNRAFNAYHQVNAVLCLSARLMLISTTIWCVQCLSLWTNLEIDLSRTDHFFIFGLSSSSFLFPPNVKVYVLDLSVLNLHLSQERSKDLSVGICRWVSDHTSTPPSYMDRSTMRKIQKIQVEKPTTSVRMIKNTTSRRILCEYTSLQIGICNSLLSS